MSSQTQEQRIPWPDALPLPLLENSGQPFYPLEANSTQTGGPVRRRRRFRSIAVVSLEVKWALSIAQYATFKTFYRDVLGLGAARFTMELRHPKTSGLEEWLIQFDGDYNAQFQEGVWIVSAKIYALYPTKLADAAPRTDLQEFLVLPDSAPVLTSDGFIVYVKT